MSRMPKYKAGDDILFQLNNMEESDEFRIRYVYVRSDGEIIYTIHNEQYGNNDVIELEIDRQKSEQLN